MAFLVGGVVLVLINGFAGAALLFGDPPDRATWTVLVVTGIPVGTACALAGTYLWQGRFRHRPNS